MKFTYLIIFLFASLHIAAQENSINFNEKLDWKEILKIASEKKQLVFVDIYTSWCAPCKRMVKETFTNKEVIEKLNKTFVNYKINAEKGEGVALSKKYGVSGFPYFIFVDEKGNLIYSAIGYKSAKDLLNIADVAVKESKSGKPIGLWDTEYKQNHTNKKWLKNYIEKRNKLRLDNNKLLDEYYSKLNQSEYLETENLKLIINSSGISLKGKVIKIISENFKLIPEQEDTTHFLQSGLIGIYDGAINKPFLAAIKDTNELVLEKEIAPGYEHLWPTKVRCMPWYKKQDGDMWRYIFYRETKNIEKFIPVAQKYLQKYYYHLSPYQIHISDSLIYLQSKRVVKKQGMDPESEMIKQYLATFTTNDHLDRLMSAAYTVYNNNNETKNLQIALKWAKRALDIKETTATLELNAKVLYKLKKNKRAIELLNSALKLCSEEKEKEKFNNMINAIELAKPL